MANGTVKWFNGLRGVGFIHPDDGSRDVFIAVPEPEQSALGALRKGQKLSYDLTQDKDGKLLAVNVKPS